MFLSRLDDVLDVIEADLLAQAPELACALLTQVLDQRDKIENNLHEAHTEGTFRRACELLGKATAEVRTAPERPE